ncbi:hypothetical protein MIND_00006700 [Mycena indigotica]|uniref:F-box domain-containing protein n=1 Tax=Mycena indigotica TaxID=2126181 RepID=A0A8H6WHC4_9AGAR|nr:uncharacterized protein MIND_00006700 [Mycena indigotica]KAF7314928.1 hypothetical protein MIND_00006700 [Mycena indigotica]
MTAHVFPNEIWMLIFDNCPLATLWAVSLTCRLFHAVSLAAFLRSLVWKSPERARQHISIFWSLFPPEKAPVVRSLDVRFTPPLRSERRLPPADLHKDIVGKISLFHKTISQLTLCGLILPPIFFDLLNHLPTLQHLVLRQCILPGPPPVSVLVSPPTLESITLSNLDRSRECPTVFSPYALLMLFPQVPFISVDRLMESRKWGKPLPQLGIPRHLTLASVAPLGLFVTRQHLTALTRFFLFRLEKLVVVIPELYRLPFREEIPVWDTLISVPRLHLLAAPLSIVRVLLRSKPPLTHLAIQGAIPTTAHVACLMNDILSDDIVSLALTVASWDPALVELISRRLPGLQSLEILYCDAASAPASASPCAADLLPHLTALCIAPFLPIDPCLHTVPRQESRSLTPDPQKLIGWSSLVILDEQLYPTHDTEVYWGNP